MRGSAHIIAVNRIANFMKKAGLVGVRFPDIFSLPARLLQAYAVVSDGPQPLLARQNVPTLQKKRARKWACAPTTLDF
jgi:hypothetical protein